MCRLLPNGLCRTIGFIILFACRKPATDFATRSKRSVTPKSLSAWKLEAGIQVEQWDVLILPVFKILHPIAEKHQMKYSLNMEDEMRVAVMGINDYLTVV